MVGRTRLLRERSGSPFVNCQAKIVDYLCLANRLTGFRVGKFPVPVLGLMKLLGCFSMTFQTGFGDIRASLERLLQFFKFAVIRGRRYSRERN